MADFDLNVEEVLESWTIAQAIRELIANALDEQVLTDTDPIVVQAVADDCWEIRDFGRGLRYEHLTLNESPEKQANSHRVIGRFGVGLKDALAVLHRRNVSVRISSAHNDITLVERPKAAFDDVVTLHARVAQPGTTSIGTSILLTGVSGADVQAAKEMFLVFAGETQFESTKYGQILGRRSGSHARIYVHGVVVAEEPNFAFSYNITSLTEPMRKALNRERSHVGRTAYSDRVKAMLLSAASHDVARVLTSDLARVVEGTNYDETGWTDVQVRACQVLSTTGQVLFATPSELRFQSRFVEYGAREGLDVVAIPEAAGRKLLGLADLAGQPVQGISQFAATWAEKFEYDFVAAESLTSVERSIYGLAAPLLVIGTPAGYSIPEVRISNTIQPSLHDDNASGVWDSSLPAIVIRRDRLVSLETFAGTLLHELAHAISGHTDLTLEFEQCLSEVLGRIGGAACGAAGAGAGVGEA